MEVFGFDETIGNLEKGKKTEGKRVFFRGIPDRSQSVPRAFLGCLIWNGQERWSVSIGTLRERSRDAQGTLMERWCCLGIVDDCMNENAFI